VHKFNLPFSGRTPLEESKLFF